MSNSGNVDTKYIPMMSMASILLDIDHDEPSTESRNTVNTFKEDVRNSVQLFGSEGIETTKAPELKDMGLKVVEDKRGVAKESHALSKAFAFIGKLVDSVIGFFAKISQNRADRKEDRAQEKVATENLATFDKSEAKKTAGGNAVSTFTALKGLYDERTALRSLDSAVESAINVYEVTIGQNAYAVKENRKPSENPTPRERLETSFKETLVKFETREEAYAKVMEMIEALGKARPDHPNAKNREIVAEALEGVRYWLSGDDVGANWNESRATAFMGSSPSGMSLLNNILKYDEHAGSDVVGRFVDKMVDKFLVVEGNDFNKTKLAELKDYIFKDLAVQPTTEEARQMISDVKSAIAKLDPQHPNALSRSAFVDALSEYSSPFTTLTGIMNYTRDEFKEELPKQINSPGTFFRANSSFTKGLMSVYRENSPQMLASITSNTKGIVTELSTTYKEMFADVKSGKSAKVDVGGGQSVEIKMTQVLGLKLAHKIFDNIYGKTPQENKDFVKLLGTETKQMFVEFGSSIRKLEGTKIDEKHEGTENDERVLTKSEIDVAEVSFNSNNLVLRGLSAELIHPDNTGTVDKAEVGKLLKVVSTILTSAAGNVTKMEREGTEYRQLPEYGDLMVKMQSTIKNLVNVHIPESLLNQPVQNGNVQNGNVQN